MYHFELKTQSAAKHDDFAANVSYYFSEDPDTGGKDLVVTVSKGFGDDEEDLVQYSLRKEEAAILTANLKIFFNL